MLDGIGSIPIPKIASGNLLDFSVASQSGFTVPHESLGMWVISSKFLNLNIQLLYHPQLT